MRSMNAVGIHDGKVLITVVISIDQDVPGYGRVPNWTDPGR